MQTLYDPNVIPIGYIVGFLAVLTYVWAASKKITTLENDNKVGKEQHHKDIKELKDQIAKLENSSIQRDANSKIERKEEITKEVTNQSGKFESINKQIEGIRSEVKVVASTVTAVDTKVDGIEKQIDDLKTEDRRIVDFFKEWNQRIENKGEKILDYVHEIIGIFIGKIRERKRDGDNPE